jgi:hypothetical protein
LRQQSAISGGMRGGWGGGVIRAAASSAWQRRHRVEPVSINPGSCLEEAAPPSVVAGVSLLDPRHRRLAGAPASEEGDACGCAGRDDATVSPHQGHPPRAARVAPPPAREAGGENVVVGSAPWRKRRGGGRLVVGMLLIVVDIRPAHSFGAASRALTWVERSRRRGEQPRRGGGEGDRYLGGGSRHLGRGGDRTG